MGSDLTHKSAQMKEENVTNGLAYGNPVAYPRGSKTPADIEREINCHEHGNTRFNNTWLVLNYFDAGFDMKVAARRIGYRSNASVAATSLRARLSRINVLSIFDTARSLINANKFDKTKFKVILEKPYEYRQKCEGWAKPNSEFYEYFAKRLVVSALAKYNGRLIITARQLGVSGDTVAYWRGLEVKDVMAKPVRYMPDTEEV